LSERSLFGRLQGLRGIAGNVLSILLPIASPNNSSAGCRPPLANTRPDALFPVSDIAMHVLGPEKSRFGSHLHITTPSAEGFEGISDKYRLMRQAVEAGVSIPETIFVPDGRLDGVSERITKYPVVIKPAAPW